MTTDNFAVRFKLRDLDRITPWGEPGRRSLSWFGLTDGVYCFDTPAGRLLECDGVVDPDLNEPWCSYYLARLFEDVLELWPRVCEPVPIDIANRYAAWMTREGHRLEQASDDLHDRWFDASDWFESRKLDFTYLSASPRFHLWRTGSDVHLDWKAVEPWMRPQAAFVLPFDSVRGAVIRFVGELLTAMAERVRVIQSSNWQPRDGVLDIRQLVDEHAERERTAKSALALTHETDWDFIRRRLGELGA